MCAANGVWAQAKKQGYERSYERLDMPAFERGLQKAHHPVMQRPYLVRLTVSGLDSSVSYSDWISIVELRVLEGRRH